MKKRLGGRSLSNQLTKKNGLGLLFLIRVVGSSPTTYPFLNEYLPEYFSLYKFVILTYFRFIHLKYNYLDQILTISSINPTLRLILVS